LNVTHKRVMTHRFVISILECHLSHRAVFTVMP
jgi:hypothetical protein